MNFNIFFTNSCNLNCYYCYEKEKNEKVISKKVLDQTLNFMDSVIKDNEESINVTTHGGEPFIAYDMIKYFIQEARRRFPKIQFSMTTNATLLTDEKIEFIMENYKSFAVSIDGIKKAHDANRVFKDGSGSYDIVINNIKKVLQKGFPAQARMTINPYNYQYLSEGIIELIEIGFTDIMPMPDTFTNEWSEEMFDDMKKELKKVILYLKSNQLDTDVSIGLIDAVKCKMKNSSCDGGITTFSINTDGEVYPCMLVNGRKEYNIGSVTRGISNEKLEHVHCCDSEIIQECQGCTRYDYCTNTRCKIINEVVQGNANYPIVARCKVENIAVELYEYSNKIG